MTDDSLQRLADKLHSIHRVWLSSVHAEIVGAALKLVGHPEPSLGETPMTRQQIDTLREQYVMQRDNDTEGGLDRDGFIRADADAWEMYPYPEDAPRGTQVPATLDDLFAQGDPDDSYQEWWL